MIHLLETPPIQKASFQLGSEKIGPLVLSWNIDKYLSEIVVEAFLYGIYAGSEVIHRGNVVPTLMGTTGISTAEISFFADFAANTVSYDVKVITFGRVVIHEAGRAIKW